MTEDLFNRITEWQDKTFPKATPITLVDHLSEEVEELRVDLLLRSIGKRLEFADCFLLLFGAAAREGMNYQEIISAIEEKFAINLTREWKEPDSDGLYKHETKKKV